MHRAGILVCLDGFMNIAMEQTEEWVDGVLRKKYGDCFLRGNNGAPQRLVMGTYLCRERPLSSVCRVPRS